MKMFSGLDAEQHSFLARGLELLALPRSAVKVTTSQP